MFEPKLSKLEIFYSTSTLAGLIGDLETLQTGSEGDAHVLLVGGKRFDLDSFPNLRGIFKTGVGKDNLPFEEAKQRGIEIVLPSDKTRQTIFRETADFACHMIMKCLYRELGDWDAWVKTQRRSLESQQLLVIGAGRIGGLVRDKMSSFCDVLTYDALGNDPSELRPMMELADCVSLHLPLNDETRHFVDIEKLSWMRNGASLVNTARGAVVDEEALFNELSSGRLFAALDVFSEEPYRGPLSTLPPGRVLLTPHVASTCREFLEGTANDFRAFVKRIETQLQ